MRSPFPFLRRVQALVAVGLVAFAGGASAAPVLGGQLFWQGGDVTLTVLPATGAYRSELRLFEGEGSRFLGYNANFTPADSTVLLTAASLDLHHNIGDELVFGIYVTNTQLTYKLGPGDRNPDNRVHGVVETLGEGRYIVGFEDLFGGGDKDYDDNRFGFNGSLKDGNPAPEPASLLLVSAALLAAGVAGRRKAD